MKRLLPLLTIVLSGALMAGCDALAGALGVDKVDVPLTSAGTLAVNGTSVAVESVSSSRSGGKLPNLFDIESVDLKPADVTFTSSSGKNASAVSGNVYVAIYLGAAGSQLPFVSGTITITNNTVTNISSALYTLGTQIQQRCQASNSGCPSPSAASGKSVSQIGDAIETYLRTSENLNVSIVTTADAGVSGTITINKITINLDF